MSQRCTCCHICHTSVKTSRRTFFPCSSCPSIICRQCIEGNGEDWETLNEASSWDCPRCRDACPCKRCRNRANSSPSKSSSPGKPSKRPLEDSDSESPEPKKAKIENQVISGLGLSNSALPRSPVEVSLSDKSGPTSWVQELHNKNEQCLSYIDRTERLLQLVREEQSRIASELDALVPHMQRENADVNQAIPV